MRGLRGCTLCLVCVGLTVMALGVSRRAEAQAASCTDPGTNLPVLLVHGWHGSPKDLAPLQAAIQSLGNVSVDNSFSYPNTAWVTDNAVGPALATRIICLADKSQAAGGVGQVVLIAHSMGGLAARCASDPTCGQADIGSRLGLVVTLGTPNLGSPLADYAAASSPGAGVNQGLLRGVLNATDAACHVVSPPASGLGLCDWFLASDPGLEGLRPGSRQLAGLPPLRVGVALTAIAGHISVTSQLFNGPTLTLADLASDGVVSVASAHADTQPGRPAPSSDPESACQLPIRIAVPVDGSGDPVTDTIANTLLGGLPSCWHGHLPADPGTQQLVLSAIRTWLQSKSTGSSGSAGNGNAGGQTGSGGQSGAVYVTDLPRNDTACGVGGYDTDDTDVTANGQVYQHNIVIPTATAIQNGVANCVQYSLGQAWGHLHLAIALSDDAPSDIQAHAVVTGDGRTLVDTTVAKGQTDVVDLDVSGVDQLYFTSNCVGACGYPPGYNVWQARLFFGDDQLSR